MVVRINGAPRQGTWFSADIRFLTLTVTGADFLADLQVTTTDPNQADVINSSLEVVLEAIETVATVIGFNVVSATVVDVMVDYAQALGSDGTTLGNQDASTVIADVTAIIDIHEVANSGFDLTNTVFTVNAGFAGAAQGTPA